jgi:hypothetical protein
LAVASRDGRRRRDVLEVDAGRVQRPVPEELLDRVQRPADMLGAMSGRGADARAAGMGVAVSTRREGVDSLDILDIIAWAPGLLNIVTGCG